MSDNLFTPGWSDAYEAGVRDHEKKLRVGDAVWIYSRKHENKQCNGYIIAIDWQSEDVVCFFYQDHLRPADEATIDMGAFSGSWTERFGGLWEVWDV